MSGRPPGVRRHGAGWRLEVRVTGHPRVIEAFPLDTPIEDIVRRREKLKRDLQRTKPARGTAGSFAADAKSYLKARAAGKGLKERTRVVNLWVQEFGTRARITIKPWEIRAVRDRWLTVGPKIVYRDKKRVAIDAPLGASAVNLRLRVLENLWTVLDGRHAPNPVREVPEVTPPEDDVRALPYDVVEAILAQMPDYRFRPVVTADQIAAIRSAPRTVPGVALARQLGLSDQIVSRVRRGRVTAPSTRDELGLSKLRLRVIAYTGLSHTELMGIGADDLHLDDAPPWVLVKGRAKGTGTKRRPQPLTEEGAAALRALAAAGGLGTFSTSAMRKTFLRACSKLGLTGLRPYDLRHSFAAEVFGKTKNLQTTQLLMRHQSQKTTLRYAQGAVSPVLAAAIAQVREAGGFGAGAILARSSKESSGEHGSFTEPSPFAADATSEPKSRRKGRK